jgi:mono/diheme cytochrome c family protein
MVRLFTLLLLAACSGATLAQPYVPDTSAVVNIELGRQIAEKSCQSCHAIGREGPSANVVALPLRELSRHYPVENLAEAFAEGVLVGHSTMPQFEFEPQQVEALLTYIQSIQTQPVTPVSKPKKR